MDVYFESSWAILSSIGIANFLFGLIIVSITRLSVVVAVPLVVSVATAVANGLCFYAFYQDHPTTQKAVASVFADLFWLIQEVGLSFYGYVILARVLPRQEKRIFVPMFWVIVAAIAGCRCAIAAQRVQALVSGSDSLQVIINHLHTGYFICIALLECVTAVFLLRKFGSAKKASQNASIRTGLLRHFMRGTEIRLATLALIGVSRAITYFFQTSLQAASSTASQIDRFIYTLECVFPMMFYIDVLASRIKFTGSSQEQSYGANGMGASAKMKSRSTPRRADHRYPGWQELDDENVFPMGLTSVSRAVPSDAGVLAISDDARKNGASRNGITKTVEVNVSKAGAD
ncbi:uncharacterized protein B0I36DRAFT_419300 [Microdochium trichocladiopsis]|uniref:Uncharacterized protein n=1 Tax=Microdochium trichocladiopsis TaxID=1682393 RepID=A0A9P8YG89_9PEZI|nr:uncharacterized protein B0I36DRAFT_419300 [Microdochium trichocladiopsis]KAH7039829.1 hypothetical protein B0I36DRAFT_419300 [Microdochium trichocladiopsis]